MRAVISGAMSLAFAAAGLGAAQGTGNRDDSLAAKLRGLDALVLPPADVKAHKPGQMVRDGIRGLLRDANRRESEAWRALKTREDWERYRDARLRALRASLGSFPEPPRDLKARVTRTLSGEGYKIENLVFESRPGLVVTANLYLPDPAVKSMPGILVCHSHHNPKSQGELQDMGMTWARLGCAVLVMDQLGHGERRQHPFTDASKYAGAFKPGRQDYYFRYNVGNQLHVVGESLIGRMVWDLMRGVDLLLARPSVDPKRIILLGAVAGGGDPAAVAAALDRRITAVAPFNFGGPQPETTFPLPKDPEDRFNYAGGGSWESTRSLRLSARDGFLPWVIVGAAAPRGLIYAHEFAWDRERDPVWKRLQKIYEWYGAPDRLASVAGKGSVRGKPPESTHCNNIGAVHRRQIYPTLKRWFGMAEPDKEYQKRRPAEELTCLTPEAAATFKPRPVYQLAADLGRERAGVERRRLKDLTPPQRADRLRQNWARLLGGGSKMPARSATLTRSETVDGIRVERILLAGDAGKADAVPIPVLLLKPANRAEPRLPCVICVAQEGKAAFLRQRAEAVAALLKGGAAVCLPDLRGTGESALAGDSRGRQSASTGLSATANMLGRSLLGARLADLRGVLAYLHKRDDIAPQRVALWGDSFAPVNAAGAELAVPLDAAKLPYQAEPLGGLLALFGALYEPEIRAVYARGGLSGYQALLESPFLYVPHDAIVPGALTAGDLNDVAAALAPRPLRLEGLVDGRNRRVAADALAREYAPARAAYEAAKAGASLRLSAEPAAGEEAARWLLAQLQVKGK